MKKLFMFFVAFIVVSIFSVAAMASEWSFYGSARMSTFYEDKSEELSKTGDDDQDLTWALQGNSRIGAKIKAGNIGGRFEYGSGVNLRLLYGTWDFGAGTLLIGQDYTPMTFWISNQVWGGDNDLLGFGQVYDGRNAQVKLKMGDFQFALIQPKVVDPYDPVADNNFTPDDTDTYIPKIEVSYVAKLGPATMHLAAGYNTYDIVWVDSGGDEEEEKVASYIYTLGFTSSFGAFFVNGDIYAGKNPASFGQADANDLGAVWDAVNEKVEDVDTLGMALIVGFKANDMLTFETGYGMAKDEFDLNGDSYDVTADSYYLNATIKLAKGCFIVPEIGKVDYGDLDNGIDRDLGDFTYYGVKWQINF